MSKKLAKRIRIFRPGTFTDMHGGEYTFSEADVQASADAYDPKVFQAPLVVGHPKMNAPAFGWVTGVEFTDDALIAENDEVAPEFAEAVSAGHYKKVSASFFPPTAKNNPVPGVYYLKHVGFLGGAAPAVSGLGTVTDPAFAQAEEDVVIEFSDADADANIVARILRNLREYFIDKEGLEEADKIIPGWEIDWLVEEAGRDDTQPAFAQPQLGDPAEPKPKETDMSKDALSADDLAARQKELDDKEAAFAEREAKVIGAENEAFVEDLIGKGQILPAEKEDVLSFMAKLGSDEVAFADGDKTSPLAAYKDQLSKRPKVVEFAEVSADKGGKAADVSFAAPDGYQVNAEQLELHAQAVAYQTDHPGTDYIDAVKAVG